MAGWRIAAGAALVLCGGAAIAAEPSGQPTGSGARVLESFARCRAIAAPDARLECFDKAAGALETAVKTNEVRIVDKQDIRKARRSLFGFTLPKIELFGGGRDGKDESDEPEFVELNTTIVSARPAANNRVELRIAEGEALWITTDPMPFPPKAGAKIRIRKGALGNYFLSIQGERPVRGMRLR